MALCFPWWHHRFDAFRGLKYPAICGLDRDPESRTYGFVPCDPERLRKHAESELNKMGAWTGRLPMDVYSSARNVQSEAGSSSVEEKMAIALTTRNHARRKGVSVHEAVLLNGGTTDASGCRSRFSRAEPITCRLPFYGQINDPERGSAYGRFTASTQEPDAQAIMIAAFALSGQAGDGDDDFVHGGDDQAQASIINPASKAQGGSYWVGPLPGVNSQAFMVMKQIPGVSAQSPEGRRLVLQAEQVCGAQHGGACAHGGNTTPEGIACIEPHPGVTGARIALGVVAASVATVGAALLFAAFGSGRLVPDEMRQRRVRVRA